MADGNFDPWAFWERVEEAKTKEDYGQLWIEFSKAIEGKERLSDEEEAIRQYLKGRF